VIPVVEGALVGPFDAVNARAALEFLGIDERRLGEDDRRVRDALVASQAPVSLATLSATTGIAMETIRKRHEPILIRQGLVAVTPFGRVATTRPTPAPTP